MTGPASWLRYLLPPVLAICLTVGNHFDPLTPAGLWAAPLGPIEPSAGTSAKAPARGPAWWKANKHRAVFVPGKGYSVDGVPGFFDENGVPIAAGTDHVGDSILAGFQSPAAPGARRKGADRTRRILDKPSVSLVDRVKMAFGKGPDEARGKRLFAAAEALARERNYAAAAPKYKHAAAAWPDSQLEEDALFMIAECAFFTDAYPQAADDYNALLKKYPATRHLDVTIARLFAIARYWQEYDRFKPHWPITPNLVDKTRRRFDTFGHALKIYEDIRLADPTGPRADDALMAAATAYFSHGRYEDADYQFDLLRREYPKSEFQFEAHLLGLQCKLRKYQGPEYDGKPLEEAQQLVKQLLRQFPDKVGRERTRIRQVQAEVAAQQALRDWRMAEYYTKGHHFGAARHYYNKLVKAHPDTKLAQQARDRLAKYSAQPDEPPPRLAWLNNLFQDKSAQNGTAVVAAPANGHVRR